jgi:hypothetical protein
VTAELAKVFAGDKAEKWPRFFEVAHDLHASLIDFNTMDSKDGPDQRVIADHVQVHEANAIGSKVTSYGSSNEPHDYTGPNRHKPVLDLDVPHFYCESTTPGHGHLIIDVEVSWLKYLKLLEALEDCGILEPGYVSAAKARGESWMRTPWHKKGDENV